MRSGDSDRAFDLAHPMSAIVAAAWRWHFLVAQAHPTRDAHGVEIAILKKH